MNSTLRRLPTVLILASTLCFNTAEAQVAANPSPQIVDQDWVLTAFPARKTVIAVAAFDNGLALALRCVNNALNMTITGLPQAPRSSDTRLLGLSVGDHGPKDGVWTVATEGGSAFSRIPAMIARQLAEGGPVQIIVPAEPGGRRTRYEMTLNPSSTAIEQVLTACGRTLVDARASEVEGNGQDGLPPALDWSRSPQPRLPESPRGTASEGYVVLSCLSQADGRATDCLIESEHPQGFNLGRAVVRSVTDARLQLTPEGIERGVTLGGRVIVFTTTFRTN